MAALDDFLAEASRRQWQLGQFDCLLVLGDWIKIRTGQDPAEDWRGQYWNAQSRVELLKRRGVNIRGLMLRAFADCGFEQTSAPNGGDVGLVKFDLSGIEHNFCRGRVGAIALDNCRWWTPLASGGAMIGRPPLTHTILAWKVP